MRKNLKLFVVLLIISIITNAQFYKHIGIKTGISISNQEWIYSNPEIKINPKNYSGFYFGMVAEIINKKYIGLAIESAYIQKGVKDIIQGTEIAPNEQGYIETGEIEYSNRFDNISFLCYLRVKYPILDFIPYLLVGPRIDYMINKDIEVFHFVSEDLEEINYGFSYGIGVSYDKFKFITPFIEIISSPDINKIYETDLLSISGYSYEMKFGCNFK